jgi:hypothetical protein
MRGHAQPITSTWPSIGSLGDAIKASRFSLILGINVWVEVCVTFLLEKSDTAMIMSSTPATR